MLELNASAAAGAPARKTAYDHDQTPDAQIIKTIETGRILPHRAAGALYGVAVLKGTTTDGSTTWRASDLYVGSSATQETDDSHELVRRRLQNHAITVTDKSKAAALAKVFTALKELDGSTAVRIVAVYTTIGPATICSGGAFMPLRWAEAKLWASPILRNETQVTLDRGNAGQWRTDRRVAVRADAATTTSSSPSSVSTSL